MEGRKNDQQTKIMFIEEQTLFNGPIPKNPSTHTTTVLHTYTSSILYPCVCVEVFQNVVGLRVYSC